MVRDRVGRRLAVRGDDDAEARRGEAGRVELGRGRSRHDRYWTTTGAAGASTNAPPEGSGRAARCWYPPDAVHPGRAAALALALVFAVCTRHAAADDAPRPEVTRLLREGVALRAEGRDLEALAAFEHAHALQPLGRVQAQRALAEQALGRPAAAAQHLVEALASTDPWIARHRGELDGALATIRAQLPASTPTATVATTPAPDAIPADTARPDDATNADTARPDDATAAAATRSGATQRDTARDGTQDDASGLAQPTAPSDARTTQPNAALLWSGTAATALGAAGAIVAAVLATTTTADYDARYDAGGCGAATSPRCDADYADTTRRLDVLRAIFHGALGLAAVGGALTLGAFVLTPTADATSAGLRLRGSF